MKELFFIGGFFPANYQEYVEKISKGVVQYSSNTFQHAFIKGLRTYFNIQLITSPFTGNYPAGLSRIYTKSFSFKTDGSPGYCIGSIKLPIVNLITRAFNLFRCLIKLGSDVEVLIYCPHIPFLLPVVMLKKRKKYHVGVIIPDLQLYSSSKSNFCYRYLKLFENFMLNKLLKHVDYLVTVTDQMSDYYKLLLNKDCIRIEGMYDGEQLKEEQKKSNAIMYAGTLDSRYGIMNLIKAYENLSYKDYELWIFGEGDMKKEICSLASRNSKVKYFGQKPHDEILYYLKKVKVLVNPRTSDGEYTKYSFPIKTMEYLASGTPTIMHHLSGLPDEYLNYLFIAKEENALGLQKAIQTVIEMDDSILDQKGLEAMNFILNEKSPARVMYNIYKYISNE